MQIVAYPTKESAPPVETSIGV